MKYRLFIAAAVLLLVSSLAYSGAANTIRTQVFVFPDNSGGAFGDMLTARDDDDSDYDDDTVFIGCGVRSFDDGVGGTFQTMFCQGTGIQLDENTFEPLAPETLVNVVCFSESPVLIDALKMIDSYSFITFRFDDTGTCTNVGVSTQSFYLPKTKANKPPSN